MLSNKTAQLKVENQQKQLLGSLILDIMLSGHINSGLLLASSRKKEKALYS